jgi:hypothetical protein
MTDWTAWVLQHTGALRVVGSSPIQTLWGGYGELLRLRLEGGARRSVILKRVLPPEHGRASTSDLRKRRSYEVEQAWYRGGSSLCDERCRVAGCLGQESWADGSLLLLEDLGEAGFHPHRPPRRRHLQQGLSWLARLHARYLGQAPDGLWDQGSYWHLETRWEEWHRMPAGLLKESARALDGRLRRARYQTVVHGDAKPSNFLWGASEERAAAVDFQYVGRGCGMRDVAYFLDSCLDEHGCEAEGAEWLERYFADLREHLGELGFPEAGAVEQEWRALYPVAWSDFQRFYQGWGRGGALGRYSQGQLQLALEQV